MDRTNEITSMITRLRTMSKVERAALIKKLMLTGDKHLVKVGAAIAEIYVDVD